MSVFRNPATGLPFPWECLRDKETVAVKVDDRMVVNDLATKLSACVAGYGIAQSVAFGIEAYLASGELQQILPDWADERYPLYGYHVSRRHRPAKVRAFLDFVKASIAKPQG